jgi:hypothetical protein
LSIWRGPDRRDGVAHHGLEHRAKSGELVAPLTTKQSNVSDQTMSAGVVVALIAAVASLVVAILNAGFTIYRERRSREAERLQKLEERIASAKAELDRIREPLTLAALGLADRIYNMRLGHFLQIYLTPSAGRRREIALTSTLYRFARYWCIVQMLYDNVALQKLRDDEATRQVESMIDQIASVFASDAYDDRKFMVWRDEQRAIAEKMKTDATPLGSIGFATFVEQYHDTFAPWFASFEQDLDGAAARASSRLNVLQQKLATLARQLDQEGAYRDKWARLLDDHRATSATATLTSPPRPDDRS